MHCFIAAKEIKYLVPSHFQLLWGSGKEVRDGSGTGIPSGPDPVSVKSVNTWCCMSGLHQVLRQLDKDYFTCSIKVIYGIHVFTSGK